MNAGAKHGGSDSGGEIAIGNQPNAGSRRANITNQLFMAWPVKNDNHQVAHVATQCLSNS